MLPRGVMRLDAPCIGLRQILPSLGISLVTRFLYSDSSLCWSIDHRLSEEKKKQLRNIWVGK